MVRIVNHLTAILWKVKHHHQGDAVAAVAYFHFPICVFAAHLGRVIPPGDLTRGTASSGKQLAASSALDPCKTISAARRAKIPLGPHHKDAVPEAGRDLGVSRSSTIRST
jgi:hypothetical protein